MREKRFSETLRVRVPTWLKERLREEAERRAITMGSLVRETLAREVSGETWVRSEETGRITFPIMDQKL